VEEKTDTYSLIDSSVSSLSIEVPIVVESKADPIEEQLEESLKGMKQEKLIPGIHSISCQPLLF
jgi:hypothetical protein